MFRILRAFNGFMTEQLFYPIALSTFLSLGLFAGRVILSGQPAVYRNLVWNVFLAWLPYVFSLAAALFYRISHRYGWLLILPAGLLWLVFFPNAPYLVTDFLHLKERPGVPLWYDILLLFAFTWTGIFLAIASLRTMQWLVRRYLGNLVSWLFVGVALALSGLGIYLGRFERWNSWDLISHPEKILRDVLTRVVNPLDDLRFLGFTILITVSLLVFYLTFISVKQMEEPKREKQIKE